MCHDRYPVGACLERYGLLFAALRQVDLERAKAADVRVGEAGPRLLNGAGKSALILVERYVHRGRGPGAVVVRAWGIDFLDFPDMSRRNREVVGSRVIISRVGAFEVLRVDEIGR